MLNFARTATPPLWWFFYNPADEAYAAAIEAFMKAVPGISHEETTREKIEAISYASSAHPRLLYGLYKSDG